MTVLDTIAAFLRVRAAGWTASTAQFYRARLRGFGTRYGPREFATLTLVDILDYLEAAGAGRSDSTQRHNAVVLEQLQKFAIEQSVLAKPIFVKLSKPPVGTRDRIPTEDETRRLLKGASPEFRRIYECLRLSGARPGELVGAQIADVDFAAGVITRKKHKTARKTGKARLIPIGQRLEKLLREAMGARPAGPVFLAPRGGSWTVSHLGKTYRQLRDEASLPKDLILYLARHEAGTRITRKFGLEQAARILGHSKIETTRRYAHLDNDELRDIQDAAGGEAAGHDV